MEKPNERRPSTKIQWHPAFCAAAELELRFNKDDLEFKREYNLSKKPLQMDLLIIEKRKGVQIQNEIGKIFRGHNIIEYKSPDDGMTIDNFFKTLGYAFLYKGLGEKVNQIPLRELTVSLFRASAPKELLNQISKEGYIIERQSPGIYYVNGLSVPTQIVVTNELNSQNHESLKVLSKSAQTDDIQRFTELASAFTEPGDKEKADAVLQVSVAANRKNYDKVRRTSDMCEALRELMKEEIEEELKKNHEQGIKGGRHPVVEKMIDNDMFIANDTYLDNKNNRIAIITGPNMAGKSTYMRQNALIVLMAQIGSFVPVQSANIGIVDRIFTRVGASDDLASGQSTFMVEMNEVANILRNATGSSLLILDEIGRGTSTIDGLSIAWAVVEYISNPKILGAKTLFATHYHELTELEGKLSNVNNYCIAVKEKGDDIVFLRKIVSGGADRSYGIQVAKLAGVPDPVIERAKVICEELERANMSNLAANLPEIPTQHKAKQKHPDDVDLAQMSLFDTVKDDDIIDEIRAIDLTNMTPFEAMNKLNEIQNKIKNRW